jgi:hypothetical protein
VDEDVAGGRRPVAVIWSFECGAAEGTLGFTYEALGFVLALRHRLCPPGPGGG